jgi:mannan endo-1,4-beta-mannosidase
MRAWPAVAALVLLAVLTACGGRPPNAGPAMKELGIFEPGAPGSYAPVATFSSVSGVRPNLDVYYSGWYELFQARFAAEAARQGAVTLVQINPTGISLAAIAAGKYDGYLRGYAAAVRAAGRRVVLSFGHEMNAPWYSWGFGNSAPATFVAAWRHIVALFRTAGARNVIWLWTVNVEGDHIAPVAPWWPGADYVTWVGLDGYFYTQSQTFESVFASTISAVRSFTKAPVLIAETGAAPDTGKPAKITDLFAGVRSYGLLGFVWFDTVTDRDWRISNDPAAVAALRAGALAYMKDIPARPASAPASTGTGPSPGPAQAAPSHPPRPELSRFPLLSRPPSRAHRQ